LVNSELRIGRDVASLELLLEVGGRGHSVQLLPGVVKHDLGVIGEEVAAVRLVLLDDVVRLEESVVLYVGGVERFGLVIGHVVLGRLLLVVEQLLGWLLVPLRFNMLPTGGHCSMLLLLLHHLLLKDSMDLLLLGRVEIASVLEGLRPQRRPQLSVELCFLRRLLELPFVEFLELPQLPFQLSNHVFPLLELPLQLLPRLPVVVALVRVDLLELQDLNLEHVPLLLQVLNLLRFPPRLRLLVV